MLLLCGLSVTSPTDLVLFIFSCFFATKKKSKESNHTTGVLTGRIAVRHFELNLSDSEKNQQSKESEWE